MEIAGTVLRCVSACRGLSPADAEAAFLAQTTMLEMYGLDLYQASWVRFTAGPLTPDTDQPDLPPSCQARDVSVVNGCSVIGPMIGSRHHSLFCFSSSHFDLVLMCLLLVFV